MIQSLNIINSAHNPFNLTSRKGNKVGGSCILVRANVREMSPKHFRESGPVLPAALAAPSPICQIWRSRETTTDALSRKLSAWRNAPGISSEDAYNRHTASKTIIAQSQIGVDGRIVVHGMLYLSRLHALTELPKGLTITGGSLDLSDCGSLTHLPSDLQVQGGNLHLWHCVTLRDLPPSIWVTGRINIDLCSPDLHIPPGFRIQQGGENYISV